MVHPIPPTVNPHPKYVRNATPWIRRSKGPCTADSAAADCRTPRIPLSIPRLTVDSADGSFFRLEAFRELTERLSPSELFVTDVLNHCEATASFIRVRANPHLMIQFVVSLHYVTLGVHASGRQLLAGKQTEVFEVEGL